MYIDLLYVLVAYKHNQSEMISKYSKLKKCINEITAPISLSIFEIFNKM